MSGRGKYYNKGSMKYKVKVTVIDKKLYPELQRQYCMDPDSGIFSTTEVAEKS